jgi:hypothetical protein
VSREKFVHNNPLVQAPNTEVIIHYPVIHNTIVVNREKDYSSNGTPVRQSKRGLMK